jgi:hypothetical protein
MAIIKFYPFSEQTEKFAPQPYPASRAVPSWYKAQPGTISDREEDAIRKGSSTSTIKRCMPIFDAMTAGYIIPFPMDIFIDATNPNKIEWSVPMPMKQYGNDMVSTHAPEQYSHYPIDKDIYHKDLFRIMPFWAVKTDPGYSSLFMHPLHQDELPFWVYGGMIDTDNFITDGHVSMLVKKNFTGIIKQGTPFIQVVPIKRDNYQMEIVDVDIANTEVKKQRLNLRSTFFNGYKQKMRVHKEYK